ncbi:acetolactate synthase small subunit [Bacilliculturomica massiliensis]|uniref:acetolactate synthase small subunit n=1 Tax=Bacilliculturomica massiliensis TaxID=1917867 RepID=UPI0010316B72|nr:acetolactate synthase small subunit [Bacilliculturomica massiliensis]
METTMKKRWISIFVENEIGVLAKVSGLFASKSYNLDTLTVGETEDPTVSRMTISLTIDDITFEQIKKQLNRSVDIIKVMDFTDIPIVLREILLIKVRGCSDSEKAEIFRIAQVYNLRITDYGKKNVLIECAHTETKNNSMIKLFNDMFSGRIEIVRGGSVGIEAISVQDR